MLEILIIVIKVVGKGPRLLGVLEEDNEASLCQSSTNGRTTSIQLPTFSYANLKESVYVILNN